MRLKKLAAILLALAVVIGTAGCAPGESEEQQEPPPLEAAAESDEPKEQPEPEPAEEPEQTDVEEPPAPEEEAEPPEEGEAEAGDESEEDPAEEESEFETQQQQPALSENELIVYSFEELKAALEANTAVTTFYLGADITMKLGGIYVHLNRTGFTIDGRVPGETTRHTLTEYNSNAYTDTIFLRAASSAAFVTFRNLDIIGYNYYGPSAIADARVGVVLTFEYCSYTGPQLCYNTQGTLRLVDTDVTTTRDQEVAESRHLEFFGAVKITHVNRVCSGFWLYSASSTVTFQPGCDVYIKTDWDVFYDSAGAPALTLGAGANVEIASYNGVSRPSHRVGDVVLEAGARLKATHTNGSGYATLRTSGNVSVGAGAALELYNLSGQAMAALELTTSNKRAVFLSPERVILYSAAYRPIKFTTNNALSITCRAINTKLTTGLPADSIDAAPSYIWNNSNLAHFTLNASYSDTTVNSFTHTINAGSLNLAELSSTNFALAGIRMLVFGEVAFEADPIYTQSAAISGRAAAGAQIRASYALGGDQTLETTATAFGWSMAVPQTPLPEGMAVAFLVHYNQLKARCQSVVQRYETVAFYEVPDVMSFATTPIESNAHYVGREQTDWSILVIDTRAPRMPFRIEATITGPLATSDESGGYSLPGALVFVSESGAETVFSETPLLAWDDDGSDPAQILIVSWEPQNGPLLYLEDSQVIQPGVYTTTIEWTLLDTEW